MNYNKTSWSFCEKEKKPFKRSDGNKEAEDFVNYLLEDAINDKDLKETNKCMAYLTPENDKRKIIWFLPNINDKIKEIQTNQIKQRFHVYLVKEVAEMVINNLGYKCEYN